MKRKKTNIEIKKTTSSIWQHTHCKQRNALQIKLFIWLWCEHLQCVSLCKNINKINLEKWAWYDPCHSLIYSTCTGSLFLHTTYSVDMLTGLHIVVVETQHKFTRRRMQPLVNFDTRIEILFKATFSFISAAKIQNNENASAQQSWSHTETHEVPWKDDHFWGMQLLLETCYRNQEI